MKLGVKLELSSGYIVSQCQGEWCKPSYSILIYRMLNCDFEFIEKKKNVSQNFSSISLSSILMTLGWEMLG